MSEISVLLFEPLNLLSILHLCKVACGSWKNWNPQNFIVKPINSTSIRHVFEFFTLTINRPRAMQHCVTVFKMTFCCMENRANKSAFKLSPTSSIIYNSICSSLLNSNLVLSYYLEFTVLCGYEMRFPFPNYPKYPDPLCKMDLDLWGRFEKKPTFYR